MRRIDAIAIGFGIFLAGGGLYIALQVVGLDSVNAGIWSQVIFTGGLVAWLISYLVRALTQNMTYNQQVKDYKDAVLQKQLEELTPEELERLQAEIEREEQENSAQRE